MLFENRLKKSQAELEKLQKSQASLGSAIEAAEAERVAIDKELAAADVADDAALHRLSARHRGLEDRVRLLSRKLELGADDLKAATSEHQAALAEDLERQEHELRAQLRKAEDLVAATAEKALAEVAARAAAVDEICSKLDPIVRDRKIAEHGPEYAAKNSHLVRVGSAWRGISTRNGVSLQAIDGAMASHRLARRSQA